MKIRDMKVRIMKQRDMKKQDMKMWEIKIREKWYFGLGQHERSTQLLSTSSQVVGDT